MRAGVDRDRERGAERRRVLGHHHREPELRELLFGERQADETARVRRHEVDLLGRDLLGRDAEVALVLAILVVHEDDHATGANLRRWLGTAVISAAPLRVRAFVCERWPARAADDSAAGEAFESRARGLLDRDALREVPRLVDVRAAVDRDVVREQLERDRQQAAASGAERVVGTAITSRDSPQLGRRRVGDAMMRPPRDSTSFRLRERLPVDRVAAG